MNTYEYLYSSRLRTMAKLNPQVIVKTVSDVVLSDAGQKFLCGTYSDGKTRSFADAMRDEYISPKDREKWEKKKAKKKGKKKDKKKKKKGKKKDFDPFSMDFFDMM